MSARPTYNLDLLLDLKMKHPEWTDEQVADALTEDNRLHGRPAVVTASVVHSAVHRNRTKWAARGFTLPRSPRRSQYIRDLMQLRGFRSLSSEENQHSLPLKRLRQCERLALGLGVPETEASKARSWEREMRGARTVVDLDGDGRAYVRAAYWYELDSEGNLIGLTAQAERDNPNLGSNLTPNLDDETERTIWLNTGLSDDAKLRLIADLRTATFAELLDDRAGGGFGDRGASDTPKEVEKIPNGADAG